jgi:multiple sugar transport system permease protein
MGASAERGVAAVAVGRTALRLSARSLRTLGLHGLLLLGLVAVLLPFWWALAASLSTTSHLLSFPASLWPEWRFANYVRAWHAAPWGRYFGNTILIATLTALLTLLTSTLAGFALAYSRVRAMRVVLGLVVAAMFTPQETTLIPLYLLMGKLGWLNTYQAQIVPWAASGFGILLMRQFLLGFPAELADAAAIDGATGLGFLRWVCLPNLKPAMVTVALFSFLGSWNAFLWPLLVTDDAALRPIEVGLQTFVAENGIDWPLYAAAAVFTIVPVVVLFIWLQRYIVDSVARSGING